MKNVLLLVVTLIVSACQPTYEKVVDQVDHCVDQNKAALVYSYDEAPLMVTCIDLHNIYYCKEGAEVYGN